MKNTGSGSLESGRRIAIDGSGNEQDTDERGRQVGRDGGEALGLGEWGGFRPTPQCALPFTCLAVHGIIFLACALLPPHPHFITLGLWAQQNALGHASGICDASPHHPSLNAEIERGLLISERGTGNDISTTRRAPAKGQVCNVRRVSNRSRLIARK
jgi:hypothetical protein